MVWQCLTTSQITHMWLLEANVVAEGQSTSLGATRQGQALGEQWFTECEHQTGHIR